MRNKVISMNKQDKIKEISTVKDLLEVVKELLPPNLLEGNKGVNKFINEELAETGNRHKKLIALLESLLGKESLQRKDMVEIFEAFRDRFLYTPSINHSYTSGGVFRAHDADPMESQEDQMPSYDHVEVSSLDRFYRISAYFGGLLKDNFVRIQIPKKGNIEGFDKDTWVMPLFDFCQFVLENMYSQVQDQNKPWVSLNFKALIDLLEAKYQKDKY